MSFFSSATHRKSGAGSPWTVVSSESRDAKASGPPPKCDPPLIHETTQSTDEKAALVSEIQLISGATAVVPVSAAVRRAMGRRTSSMSMKGGKLDRLYNLTGTAAPFYKMPKVDNAPYRITQMAWTSAWLVANTVTVDQAVKNFQFSDLDQYTSLAAVFDQYRILKVECWIEPRVTTVTQAAATNLGQMASVIDYDDSATLTNFASYLDYQNVFVGGGADGHYRCFSPHAAIAAYSGTFASFANEASPWIDAASPNVQHYGLKACTTVADAAYVYDLRVRYHLELRNVR